MFSREHFISINLTLTPAHSMGYRMRKISYKCAFFIKIWRLTTATVIWQVEFHVIILCKHDLHDFHMGLLAYCCGSFGSVMCCYVWAPNSTPPNGQHPPLDSQFQIFLFMFQSFWGGSPGAVLKTSCLES